MEERDSERVILVAWVGHPLYINPGGRHSGTNHLLQHSVFNHVLHKNEQTIYVLFFPPRAWTPDSAEATGMKRDVLVVSYYTITSM